MFVLRSTFDVRHSFFVYMYDRTRECSTFDVRRSIFLYACMIEIGIVRRSTSIQYFYHWFVIRRSSFNFVYTCMVEIWNVRRSTLSYSSYMSGISNIRPSFDIRRSFFSSYVSGSSTFDAHSIFLSYMHTKKNLNDEHRIKDS